jgi:hypothetical protein
MAAIREPMSESSYRRVTQPEFNGQSGGAKDPHLSRHRSSRTSLENLREQLLADPAAMRNKRDVWTVSTEPFSMEFCTACQTAYSGIEYAALALVGDPKKGLCTCGRADAWLSHFGMSHRAYSDWLAQNPPKTVSWKAGCECAGASVVPAVVLDPFMGSGTTALVALRAGRHFVGIDLNPNYVALAEARIRAEKVQKRMF